MSLTLTINLAGSTDEEAVGTMLGQLGQILATGLAYGTIVSGELTTVPLRELVDRSHAEVHPNRGVVELATIRDAQIRAVQMLAARIRSYGPGDGVDRLGLATTELVQEIRDGLQP